jgi:hypothetical protein
MTPNALLLDLLRVIRQRQRQSAGRRELVLLDEINSMPCVWIIREIVCDGFILGRRIPPNIRFVCIMNPLRRRPVDLPSDGLHYSP